VDNLFEKCTWEFEFVVPRYLEERHTSRGDDGSEDMRDASPTVVVCSGDLMEQVSELLLFCVPPI
jgi:transcription initiation factor TFIID subunit 2